MIHARPVLLIASLLMIGCGASPMAPGPTTSTVPVAATPPITPTLVVERSPAVFHVGAAGEIRYSVTGVTALASVTCAFTDGMATSRSSGGPAPAAGVLMVAFGQRGEYEGTVTAKLADGTALNATVTITVIE